MFFLFYINRMLFSSHLIISFSFSFTDILYSELNKYLNNQKKEQDGTQFNKCIHILRYKLF